MIWLEDRLSFNHINTTVESWPKVHSYIEGGCLVLVDDLNEAKRKVIIPLNRLHYYLEDLSGEA